VGEARAATLPAFKSSQAGPQGLKPPISRTRFGTAEAVPSRTAFVRVEAGRDTHGEIWVLAKAEGLLQKSKKPSCWRSSAHHNASRISGMSATSICRSNAEERTHAFSLNFFLLCHGPEYWRASSKARTRENSN
jgi:hypothetical protein